MFEALRTRRRVILSGTPIQNDLGEFHAMVSYQSISSGMSLNYIMNRLTFAILVCLVCDIPSNEIY